MKFRETRFARQLFAVVAGLVLAVATVAFVTIPASLGGTPGDRLHTATAPANWHPT